LGHFMVQFEQWHFVASNFSIFYNVVLRLRLNDQLFCLIFMMDMTKNDYFLNWESFRYELIKNWEYFTPFWLIKELKIVKRLRITLINYMLTTISTQTRWNYVFSSFIYKIDLRKNVQWVNLFLYKFDWTNFLNFKKPLKFK